MNKQQLIGKVRAVARRRGTPTLKQIDFCREAKVTFVQIERHFDRWIDLCAAAGVKPAWHRNVRDDEIFAALRDAFLSHGGICSQRKLDRHFPYSVGAVVRRWSGWSGTLAAFRDWALVHAPDFPHLDELARRVAKAAPVRRSGAAWVRPRRSVAGPVHAGAREPLVGDGLAYRGMMYAPLNELGVVMLFAAAAPDLGFVIESVGAAFPDCHARRQIAPGRWQRVRIEFEFESRSFRTHRHDPKGCDLIVCWQHNWPECPVLVLELKSELLKLARA